MAVTLLRGVFEALYDAPFNANVIFGLGQTHLNGNYPN